MSQLFSLRNLARPLVRRPAVTAIVLVTLAVGIGANTAIFSLVHGVLLQPLPYPEPERLVTVWEDHTRRDGPAAEWTGVTTFTDWRDENRSFEEVAFYGGWSPNLGGDGDPEQLQGMAVSPGWWRVLGVQPAFGRAFAEADSAKDAPDVALLGHDLWQRRFAGDTSLVGRTVQLDDVAVSVVGILPEGFTSLVPGTEIWRPFPHVEDDRGGYYVRVVGRLRDGLTLDDAQRDMTRVAGLVAERAPDYYEDVGVRLVPLHERVVGPARPAVLALSGAVALLLLVACANVANLLLVDAVGRGSELAVRSSLGAGRGLLAAQLVLESLLLAGLGGAGGLFLGAWGTRLLVTMAPAGTPRIENVGLQPAVVAFAVVLTLLTGLVAGLMPALRGLRVEPADALRPGMRVERRHDGRLRAALVVGEAALALCLLAGSGLLLKSFWGLLQVDLGLRPQGVQAATLVLPDARYPEREQRIAFYRELVDTLAARPEVASAAATSILPLSGNGTDTGYSVEGTEPKPAGQLPAAWYRMVTPDYYRTLGIELVAGRPFNDGDTREQPGVVAVSERFARRWFGQDEALGRRMKFGTHDSEMPWMTIVAVVRDVRDRSPMQPYRDDIYLPHSQWGSGRMAVVVRPRADTAVAPVLGDVLRQLDPALPATATRSLEAMLSDQLWLPRLASQVVGAFAVTGLLLAALGLYGVLAHSVTLRRREMGIRQALGADRGRLLQLVLGQGLRLAGAGVVLGTVLSWIAASGLESVLHEVEPRDPAVFAVTAAVLLAVALVAAWLPAARAASGDPATSLRDE